MNLLWLLLAWRQSDKLLDEIRRSQLTPMERAALDAAEVAAEKETEEKEERLERNLLYSLLIIIPILLLGGLLLHWWQ